jgi:hypothetical protein
VLRVCADPNSNKRNEDFEKRLADLLADKLGSVTSPRIEN